MTEHIKIVDLGTKARMDITGAEISVDVEKSKVREINIRLSRRGMMNLKRKLEEWAKIDLKNLICVKCGSRFVMSTPRKRYMMVNCEKCKKITRYDVKEI